MSEIQQPLGRYLTVFVVGGVAGTVITWAIVPWSSEAAWFTGLFAGGAACAGAYSRLSSRAMLCIIAVGCSFALGLGLLYPLWPFLMLILNWFGFCVGMVMDRLLRGT